MSSPIRKSKRRASSGHLLLVYMLALALIPSLRLAWSESLSPVLAGPAVNHDRGAFAPRHHQKPMHHRNRNLGSRTQIKPLSRLGDRQCDLKGATLSLLPSCNGRSSTSSLPLKVPRHRRRGNGNSLGHSSFVPVPVRIKAGVYRSHSSSHLAPRAQKEPLPSSSSSSTSPSSSAALTSSTSSSSSSSSSLHSSSSSATQSASQEGGSHHQVSSPPAHHDDRSLHHHKLDAVLHARKPTPALGDASYTHIEREEKKIELICDTPEWHSLLEHARNGFPHLRELMADEERVNGLTVEHDGIIVDFSRQKMTQETLQLLMRLSERADLRRKIQDMADGKLTNPTEARAVLHMALRADKTDVFKTQIQQEDGKLIQKDVVPEVHNVLERIEDFAERVRNGEWRGARGAILKNVIVVGIGGSYLATDFVSQALAMDPNASKNARERGVLRFLSNVDPVDASQSVKGLEADETLVIVISKTFTTSETMLNAKTLKNWLIQHTGNETAANRHVVAVTASEKNAIDFGVAPENVFEIWDWVGGRYSVSSAVGFLPLSLQYGAESAREFLAGAREMDRHFLCAPPERNLPIVLGLLAIWQTNFQGFNTRALIAYSQALAKFAPHVQQLAMESNGKSVTAEGAPLPYSSGEIEFGEPGTNAQHSFFQLLHQGRVVPVDFIGFSRSQSPIEVPGEEVANHDELMANFFAQPDALAFGETEEQLRSQGVPEELIPHKVMHGDRPSTIILIDRALDAHTAGQLLALYEHRVAVQGFIWDINSFDQYGVELGKNLGRTVRNQIIKSRTEGSPVEGFNPSTKQLLNRYLKLKEEPSQK